MHLLHVSFVIEVLPAFFVGLSVLLRPITASMLLVGVTLSASLPKEARRALLPMRRALEALGSVSEVFLISLRDGVPEDHVALQDCQSLRAALVPQGLRDVQRSHSITVLSGEQLFTDEACQNHETLLSIVRRGDVQAGVSAAIAVEQVAIVLQQHFQRLFLIVPHCCKKRSISTFVLTLDKVFEAAELAQHRCDLPMAVSHTMM